MTTFDMWKGIFTLKIALIFTDLIVFSFGNTTVFIVLGIILLLGCAFLAFRQGQSYGHESCNVRHSLLRMEDSPEKLKNVEPKTYKQCYSVSNGIKSIFAGGIVGYVINVLYIIVMLTGINQTLTYAMRLAALLVSLPYWPILAAFHETFALLSPDIVIMLMAGPFLLPLVQFAGYMQGPKLWEHTEKAMAEGKRRAKARSRIVKKNQRTPRSQRPEI